MNELEYEVGSRNVFADIGFADPVEARAKADLAANISLLIEDARLSDTDAAELLGIDQAALSRLLIGKLKGFSIAELMKLHLKLNQDIEIRIKKHRDAHAPPGIQVMA